jgi:uncharacterized Tic20 family protein
MPSTIPHTGPYDSDFDDPLMDVDLHGYEPDSKERSMGMLAHLAGYAGLAFPFGSVLGPFLVYILKRDESAYVEDQAREALNFQLTIALASVVSIVLMFVLIGFALIFVVGIWWLVGTAIGATKANAGEWYRYPATIRFVKG